LIKKLQTEAQFDNAIEIIKVDGLRVEYQDGFGLMRASNTTPVIVLRFEAENKDALERIQNSFRGVLSLASPGSSIPF
jgi:phosphomannomutase/phosphoglucomutase